MLPKPQAAATMSDEAKCLPAEVNAKIETVCSEIGIRLHNLSVASQSAAHVSETDWWFEAALKSVLDILLTDCKKTPEELLTIVYLRLSAAAEARLRALAAAKHLDFDALQERAARHFAPDKLQPHSSPLTDEELKSLYEDDQRAHQGGMS